MALTGHLSDLSLSELIEFFCNQRKTGSLKVLYPDGPGYFFLQAGSVVDARIGVLRGIDAVYYALTLPNAKFEFSATTEPVERTINQPWTQVVLEGLRRLDEGIVLQEAFPVGYGSPKETAAVAEPPAAQQSHLPALFSFMSGRSVQKRKTVTLGAVGVALLVSVAAIGIPAGWYRQNKAAVRQNEPVAGSTVQQPLQPVVDQPSEPVAVEANKAPEESSAPMKRREKERRPHEPKMAASNQSSSFSAQASTVSSSDTAKSGPKRVVVTVMYDEAGRVTQASGADATALRIARQKRFPAGKGGSATVTIPIN